MEKSADDCYFYYYSTCTKGDDCPYRHCPSALGSEVMCTHWQNGRCLRPNECKYRHMESRIKRSAIQCWFETQPSGCRKPHCVFLHKKPRNIDDESTTTEGLILPVVTSAAANPSGDNNESRDNGENVSSNPIVSSAKKGEDCSKMKLFDDSDYVNQSPTTFNESSANIEPISISLNDFDEESDDLEESERLDSSQNSTTNEEISTKRYSSANNLRGDFGVKTLEQIRMEKVFNSTSDDISLVDDNYFDNNNLFKNESQLQTDRQLKSNQINKDLRVKIRRQKFNNSSEAIPSASNRNASESSSDSAADFGIKTLDQIRKERIDANKKELEQTGLKENQEPRGVKRSAADSQPPVIKLRRSGPTVVSSLKVQQQDKCEIKEDSNDSKDMISDQTVTTNECPSNQSNVITSTDTHQKPRIDSIDADLDDFELFDGEPPNVDSNEAIDDEDDELMREINQVINS